MSYVFNNPGIEKIISFLDHIIKLKETVQVQGKTEKVHLTKVIKNKFNFCEKEMVELRENIKSSSEVLIHFLSKYEKIKKSFFDGLEYELGFEVDSYDWEKGIVIKGRQNTKDK